MNVSVESQLRFKVGQVVKVSPDEYAVILYGEMFSPAKEARYFMKLPDGKDKWVTESHLNTLQTQSAYKTVRIQLEQLNSDTKKAGSFFHEHFRGKELYAAAEGISFYSLYDTRTDEDRQGEDLPI